MRVCVLGGTRFIGPRVVARLQAAGHAVTLFHRGKTGVDRFPGLPRLIGDRRRLADHADALRAARPDVVVDMIALTAADAAQAVAVFRGIARRLVVVSSADVYRAFGRVVGGESGPVEPGVLAEDAPLRTGRYPYRGKAPGLDDYDKILVEEAVLAAGNPEGAIVRLPMVYGPDDGQHRFGDVVRLIRAGARTIAYAAGEADWRCSRIAVDDAAAAIVAASTHPAAAGRGWNAAEPDAPTVAEWARMAGAALAWRGDVVARPAAEGAPDLPLGLACPQDVVLDTTAIRGTLGYREGATRAESVQAAVTWEAAQQA